MQPCCIQANLGHKFINHRGVSKEGNCRGEGKGQRKQEGVESLVYAGDNILKEEG